MPSHRLRHRRLYAANIADMTTDEIASGFLIGPVVQSKQIVEAEKGRVDGSAVILDTDPERAKAIVDVVRDKYPKNKFRMYESENEGRTWKQV